MSDRTLLELPLRLLLSGEKVDGRNKTDCRRLRGYKNPPSDKMDDDAEEVSRRDDEWDEIRSSLGKQWSALYSCRRPLRVFIETVLWQCLKSSMNSLLSMCDDVI